MQSAKTLFKLGALEGTRAIGIVLNHSGSKHLAKGDRHTFENGANAFENGHGLIIQAGVGDIAYAAWLEKRARNLLSKTIKQVSRRARNDNVFGRFNENFVEAAFNSSRRRRS